MKQVTFERIDYGIVTLAARKRVKGKHGETRVVEQLAYREEIIAIVDSKRFSKWAIVPYIQGDGTQAKRRMAEFLIRWRELTEEIAGYVFA